jgi:dTDP-4-amino-4,6-dideoxygalactose transaminase
MLPFIRPTIPPPDAWLPYLQEAYQQRRFANFGPLATRLEHALTDKYGNGQREAVLVASGTAGLTAALLALNVRGKVVMPAFTFPATAHAALCAGCQPLLCDVSPQTWELDPGALSRLLQRETVGAVIHVRAFGFCRDLNEIEDVVRPFGVPLLVDAAAALGGQTAQGAYVGCQGDLEVFSLHATKVFEIGRAHV